MAELTPWLIGSLGLIIGLFLGWLFGRSGRQEDVEQIASLHADLERSSALLAECRTRNEALSLDLTECLEERARLVAFDDVAEAIPTRQTFVALDEPDEAAEVDQVDVTRAGIIDLGETRQVDDFTQIPGIGPAYAAHLADAGIITYADLAAADPAELAKAVNVRPWQQVDTTSWTVVAADLARRPAKVKIGDDLQRIEGIGPAYATRLRAANITTFGQLADSDEEMLAVIIGAPAWRKLAYGDWITQARLAAAGDDAALEALQERLNRRKANKLALIAGLGPQSIQVLEDAGIHTYADLAAADPDSLKEIFAKAGARGGNYASWIEEAELRAAGKRVPRKATRTRALPSGAVQQRSCPQDLEEITGIGRIYEQRLYDVGVGTYWEVGVLPDAELTEILNVQDFQDVDLAEIKASAQHLAAATETVGHTWDGTEPDDFEAIAGIGPVMERRLYAAGICTYAALAAATVETLENAVHAPNFQHPDYQAWIAQAQMRLV
jgi:predicted flap endonuclease-1-like 5' DNA nuclease